MRIRHDAGSGTPTNFGGGAYQDTPASNDDQTVVAGAAPPCESWTSVVVPEVNVSDHAPGVQDKVAKGDAVAW